MLKWDVVVIGGGHAGCEAAVASARMGCATLLLTLDPSRIGVMSCNPAMGGLAKGQLIKEIDALGGVMGINTDRTAIQYRRLNSSKGPAVRSSRAQCDKALYAQSMQSLLAGIENLTVKGGEVATITASPREGVTGIALSNGEKVNSRCVVVTSGTFMRAVMHTGFEKSEGGRAGDASALSLSSSLEELGFRLTRLKTGTPPRLHKESINYGVLEPQPGDEKPVPFSFYSRLERFPLLPQIECHITYTNEQTHEIIERNFEKSPMFTGVIKGVGPRYCPSIEDKVKRFRERDRHQIFLEPEGLNTDEVYVNGISTSLPREVQDEFVRSVKGLERAQFIRYGYAVEYDAIDARQLKSTLESKEINGLYMAGQVNGTSGYEEAGAQGLVAGINAALKAKGRDPFTLTRMDGYIGVLVDDLILKGADEPYRMFTSRAEYRLLLREDNADLRLSQLGRDLGLLGDEAYQQFSDKKAKVDIWRERLKTTYVMPTDEVNAKLESIGSSPLKDRASMEVMLRRPEIKWQQLLILGLEGADRVEDAVGEQLEIQTKYEGYIRRDLDALEGLRKHEMLKIPRSLVYDEILGLSNEAKGKFSMTRPETIGQASRIQGVTPAAVATLLIHIKMYGARTAASAHQLGAQ